MTNESPMQPDTIPTPHGWQLVYLALTSIVTSAGTLIVDRLIKRRREPAEIRKIDAETRSIHMSSDLAPLGITLETFREIQTVIQKAEDRRAEWHLKEEQMRGQVVHWRCRAEELDGELIDLRDQNAQHETRARLHEHQIKKLKALLSYHNISYAELDTPRES